MVKTLLPFGVVLALAAAGCNNPDDNPTTVHDLRVLGMQFETPDIMAPTCDLSAPTTQLAYATQVKLTALIADPNGDGRDIQFDLRACAWPGDRTCTSDTDSVLVTSGTLKAGEWSYTFRPATLFLTKHPDDKGNPEPLLQQVFEQDTYKGLGGLRMPFSLHLKVGGEEVYAQKLMVFWCKFFPEMNSNQTPVLPGLSFEGAPWAADAPVNAAGKGPFKIKPDDFSQLEESYVVPSFELKPVHLEESWKISWMTTYGRMSSSETGGTDIDQTENKPDVQWVPPQNAEAKDVTIYAVVRDGRGGESWLVRKVSFAP